MPLFTKTTTLNVKECFSNKYITLINACSLSCYDDLTLTFKQFLDDKTVCTTNAIQLHVLCRIIIIYHASLYQHCVWFNRCRHTFGCFQVTLPKDAGCWYHNYDTMVYLHLVRCQKKLQKLTVIFYQLYYVDQISHTKICDSGSEYIPCGIVPDPGGCPV